MFDPLSGEGCGIPAVGPARALCQMWTQLASGAAPPEAEESLPPPRLRRRNPRRRPNRNRSSRNRRAPALMRRRSPKRRPCRRPQDGRGTGSSGLRLDRFAVAGGWLGLVVVVLLIGWAAVSYRQQVATIVAAIGEPVFGAGPAGQCARSGLHRCQLHREHEDKETVLAVTGKLVNVSGREMAVPPIRVILTGANGHELYHWDFTPEVTVLGAGKSANFLTRLSSPPGGARHLTLEFADGKG